ncbi:MAG: RluA family pseudouridine synthase [Rickettsiales bacterium]|jgi:23S rRNA pseudouridine955/2504/2580 synthase|nr:RluA family pseudouridine synthase [Rickettsiales bacterium]
MTDKIQPLKVPATMDGVKLDRFLFRHFPGLPRAAFHKACRSGELRVDSKRMKGTERIAAGALVRVPPLFKEFEKTEIKGPKPQDGSAFSLSDLEFLRKTIIYNDDDMVAFNKPAGLAAQGGTGIAKSLDKMAAALFPGKTVLPVHRLDKETSGVIIFAKNLAAARDLSAQLQDKSAAKEYLAVLAGDIKKKKGVIETMIAKKDGGDDLKNAITEYEVLGSIPGKMSLVRFNPKTGRTHQLRIHSAKELRAAIFGDGIYGHKGDAAKYGFGRISHLHLLAKKLSVRHPATGEPIELSVPVPEFMQCAVKGIMGH